MSETSYIFEVNETNINEVVQLSARVPVLLDFWAEWCEPCKALAPVLEKLANEYQGKFVLAKVDADANQMLAQQLAVRSIPALKMIVQGQLAGELDGAQPESELRTFLAQFVGEAPEAEDEGPNPDDFMGQVQRAREMGAHDEAINALQAAIQEQPKELSYQALLADVLIDAERIDDAKAVLDNISDEKIKAPGLGRLFFYQELAGFETAESLQYRVAQDSNDMEARYYLAATCIMANEVEAAMELLLEVVAKDRSYKDDGARTALLKIFDMLAGDPLIGKYRRRLFASLH